MSIVRVSWWRWWVCGLLLLATMVNYMDRQTFNLLAKPINDELSITKQGYGSIEAAFPLAFGVGAIVFGFLVDRFNPYWVYPLAGHPLVHGRRPFRLRLQLRIDARLPRPARLRGGRELAVRSADDTAAPVARGAVDGQQHPAIRYGGRVNPATAHPDAVPERGARAVAPGRSGSSGGRRELGGTAVADPAPDRPGPRQRPGHEARDAVPTLPTWLTPRFAALIILVITINTAWHSLRAWTASAPCGRDPLLLAEPGEPVLDRLLHCATRLAGGGGDDAGADLAHFRVHTSRLVGLPVLRHRRDGRLPAAAERACCSSPCSCSGRRRSAGRVPESLLVHTGHHGAAPGQGERRPSAACRWGFLFLWHNAVGWYVEQTKSYTLPFIISAVLPLIGFAAIFLLWGDTPDHKPRPPGGGRPGAAGGAGRQAGSAQQGQIQA